MALHDSLPAVYYAVVDPAGDLVQVVEADFANEAIQTVEAETGHEAASLHAREASQDEVFRYLLDWHDLSYRDLQDQLEVSRSYLQARAKGRRTIRRLDVLALERLRQLRERENS